MQTQKENEKIVKLHKVSLVDNVELFVMTPVMAASELIEVECDYKDLIGRLLLSSTEQWKRIQKDLKTV